MEKTPQQLHGIAQKIGTLNFKQVELVGQLFYQEIVDEHRGIKAKIRELDVEFLLFFCQAIL